MKTMEYHTITERAEVIRYLHMYYDLDEEVRETMFARVSWDEMRDARDWHMQTVYEDLQEACSAFENATGYVLKLESVHGPGTEQYFPPCAVDEFLSSGPEELQPIDPDKCAMCLEMDVADTWNAHISEVNRWAPVVVECDDHDDDWKQANWLQCQEAQSAYIDALENALQSVCDVLNRYQSAEEDYTFTREFWEYEAIDSADDEAWFTADGTREYRRDARCLWSVDTGDTLDVIFENRSPAVIVAREYLDA